MTGYESYLSSFPPKPQYRREEYYAHGNAPLVQWLRGQGVDISTERRATKILCGSDAWARSYTTADGGVVEVRAEPYSCIGEYVVVFIYPDDVPAYRQYNPPLPFWAWISG
mgnify:CR=1 FL=1